MLNNMKVGTRLLAGFLVVALLGSVVAGIAIYNMSQMNTSAKRAYEFDLMGMSATKEANINLLYISRAIRNVLLVQASERTAAVAKVREARQGLQRELERARPLFYSEAGKAAMAAVDRGLADYDPVLEKAIKIAADDNADNHQAAVDFVIKTFAAKTGVIDDLLSEMSKVKEVRAAESAARAEQAYLTTRNLSLALVLASLGIGIGLGAWITRGLTRQLGGEPDYAAQAAGRIAAGELAMPIELHEGDSRSLLFAMESMRTELARIVSQVRNGTDTIATASSQIASGNLDLSSRTEEQASSLEETASSMEELTSTVKQNADNARQANVLAVSASEVAQRGGAVVSQVVQTMSSINDSSRKIVDIIGVIDGIAFQTNILALNAAVEAARAGEQGRGFAVVASEVRNLAQRSASAAKEIKGLINDSVEKVDAGGKLVDQAGVTMTEIVESITRVTDIMSEIAEASAEQFSGIEQINSAVAQMDEVTQQNAALVEEAAAAASSMQEQAAMLSQIVSVFQLGEQQAQAAPLRRPAMAAKPSLRLAPAPARARPHLAPVPVKARTETEEWETF